MWHDYYNVAEIGEAVQILAERGERARIVAGGTDIILEIERGERRWIDALIDITRVPGLDEIVIEEAEVSTWGRW